MIVFAGFLASDFLREEAFRLQEILKERVSGSFPAKENCHVTLAYLGEVNENRIGDILQILYALPFPECELTFDTLETFGSWHRDAVVFTSRCPESLMAYRSELHERLKEKGFIPDPAPFCPHITLVRAKLAGNDLSGMEVRPVTMRPQGAVLFHSFQSGGKRVYLPLG